MSIMIVAGIGCIIAAFVLGADPKQIKSQMQGRNNAKLQTQELNITADQIRKLDIDCGSGDVNLSTIAAQKTDLDLGSGDVTLIMSGREKDYNYDLDTGSGDVKIGDTLYEDDFKKHNTNASKWISIDCGSGDLTIDFDNEIL